MVKSKEERQAYVLGLLLLMRQNKLKLQEM